MHAQEHSEDLFDLARFVDAQVTTYEDALSEIRAGQKRSHWMWYIFPQLRGLGHSSTAQYYGITGADEARAYLAHPLLGPRLVANCEAVLEIQGKSATEILGTPDDMKLRSCATLFEYVTNGNSVYSQILEKYFNGERDSRTLELLRDS